jgi:uncharacterized protein YodC (DUF2158 family)
MLNVTELRIGDAVRLKSGSPDLKVVAADDIQVTVEWHDGVELRRWEQPKVCFSLVISN